MSRNVQVAGLVAALAVAAGGCGGDEELPVYVRGGWQVRCPVGLAGCLDGRPHTLEGYADELQAGQAVSCQVSDAGGGKKSLTLSLRDGGDALRLSRVVFDPDTGSVDGCRVVVEDGDNRYEAYSDEGACGSAPPTASGQQRCQLQVRRGEDDGSGLGPPLEVVVHCLSIVGPANPGRLQRNVVAVRGGEGDPAFLQLANCPGF